MKSTLLKIIFGLIFTANLTSGYAFDFPTNLLVGTWTSTSTSSDPDIIVINADKSMTYTQGRQVGRLGSKIPFPTVCYYKQYGAIKNITFKGNDIDIFYSVDHAELINTEGSSTIENCEIFLEGERNVSYFWKITMLDKNTAKDTWYQTIFHKS